MDVMACVRLNEPVHGDGIVCFLYLVVRGAFPVDRGVYVLSQKPVPLPQDVLFFFLSVT